MIIDDSISNLSLCALEIIVKARRCLFIYILAGVGPQNGIIDISEEDVLDAYVSIFNRHSSFDSINSSDALQVSHFRTPRARARTKRVIERYPKTFDITIYSQGDAFPDRRIQLLKQVEGLLGEITHVFVPFWACDRAPFTAHLNTQGEAAKEWCGRIWRTRKRRRVGIRAPGSECHAGSNTIT